MPSEPGVGWRFLVATSRVAQRYGLEVVVLTTTRSHLASQDEIVAQGFAGVTKSIPVKPFLHSRFFRWHRPRFTRIEHFLWALACRRAIHELERDYNFKYAQHVTFASELLLPPIVFCEPRTTRVWGPVGAGGVRAVFRIPPVDTRARLGYWLQTLRDRTIGQPARYVARRVDLVLAQNDVLRSVVPKAPMEVFPNVVLGEAFSTNARLMSDVVQPAQDSAGQEAPSPSLICVGHFIPRKRFEIAVGALQSPRLADWRLVFVGSPLQGQPNRLETYASRLGVRDRIDFVGNLPPEEVAQQMMKATVLLHPSAREGASGVVGEATSLGLPVVCFAGTGAASVLCESGCSGVVVDPTSDDVIDALATAVLEAAQLPRLFTERWTEVRLEELAERLLWRSENAPIDAAREI